MIHPLSIPIPWWIAGPLMGLCVAGFYAVANKHLGISGAYVQAVDFARAAGYQRMALWTNDILHAARAIYIAEGFKLVAEERHHSFGKDLVGQNWELTL